jgi:hypothetical protein
VICTLIILGHIFTFKHLCLHSITKILRNGPKAHFPFKLGARLLGNKVGAEGSACWLEEEEGEEGAMDKSSPTPWKRAVLGSSVGGGRGCCPRLGEPCEWCCAIPRRPGKGRRASSFEQGVGHRDCSMR